MSQESQTPVVNARFLTQNLTGVQRFASEICLQLKELDPEIRFITPGNIKHKALAEKLNAKVVQPLGGHLWEQFILPSWLRRNGSPLLVNLGNTGARTYSRQVVTIHDMAFKVQPLWFARSFQLWYDYLIPIIARNSKLILTVSQSSRQDIIKFTDADPSKIHVIYNAIPESFIKSSEPGVEDTLELPKKYVLYVGAINPRKNLRHMIEAFNLLEDDDLRLIMVGEEHASFADYQLQLMFMDNEKILLKSKLSDAELIKTYQNAKALVNVSYHEGFGLPLLEAMHLGVPVICSDIPAYREIFGKAAILVDPRNSGAIGDAIENVIHMNGTLQKNIEKGKMIASQFSYKRSAEKILDSISNL